MKTSFQKSLELAARKGGLNLSRPGDFARANDAARIAALRPSERPVTYRPFAALAARMRSAAA